MEDSKPAGSLPWTECVSSTVTGVRSARARASVAVVRRGSASRPRFERISSRRARFSGAEMISSLITFPSAVRPITSVRTRSGAASIILSNTCCC